MCGRFQLQVCASDLQEAHPNTTWRDGHEHLHDPRQQVCPTTNAPVLVAKPPRPAADASVDGAPGQEAPRPPLQTELVLMKWGLARPASAGPKRAPLINARRETLLELPTFRRALYSPGQSRRCAVPVTAFYEWHRTPPPGKAVLTPYLVRSSGCDEASGARSPPVAFVAGLYDDCGDAAAAPASCAFVVVTTAACKQFAWLHHRQPVFLATDAQLRLWLDARVPPERAVSSLLTHTSFSCTRMLKDLSGEAPKRKETRQVGIRSFFQKRKTRDAEPEASTPDTKKQKR